MNPAELLAGLSPPMRIAAIVLLAILAHVLVRVIRSLSGWLLVPGGQRRELWRRYPRLETVMTIISSTLTFVIYFAAIGLLLEELTNLDLRTYVASTAVIGLAVAFGMQGLIQDFVTGLTLTFTDVLNIGDVVDISGQTGRVERVGLRFTTLVNFLDQSVNIPNRSIAQINRYRRGYVRAYVDIQLPEGGDAEAIKQAVTPLAHGMRAQFGGVILSDPEIMNLKKAASGEWSYLRIKFRIWPGQGSLVETNFRQRVLAAMRGLYPDYAEWMIVVTYRAE